MPKFIIEREIPGAGKLSPKDLQAISQKSCSVLQNLGPQIQWVESYVTDDKIYCVYIAPNEEMIREHARQGGWVGMLAPRLGGRDVWEVGLSLNGVFGRLTASGSMIASGRAKSEWWTKMVGSWG
jgi:hypothetical protein